MKQYLVFGIFLYLARHKKTTAKQIAEHFEVSVRSIYRYIDALCIAGVPIITNVGKYGGIILDDNFCLEDFLLKQEIGKKL